ncbi:MAG: alpha/beta hydrolase, partial [Anaerolineae bacterium]|nr:alpha/beta hydrolase [Anaerolineae bacterium]
WEETMVALPDGYRGIAPDNRGYGGADPEKKIDATRGLGDLSDDVAALLDHLDIDKAHVVGHSLGGSVIWRLMIDYPQRIRSVTMIAPGSPYGFGGTKGLDGAPCFEDFAGSGAGIVSPEFVKLIAEGDRSSDHQSSPRNVMNLFYWKPPFKSPREEELLSSMLSIHIGEHDYAGDSVTSDNWPGAAPGSYGPNNAIAPKYTGDVSALYQISSKPVVCWIHGSDDQIVSDSSFFELGTLGAAGAVPGWPGMDVFPPQPMIGQTRAVLEQYVAHGGKYSENVIADAGHSPYLEKPDEFNAIFHKHIEAY